MHMISGTRFVRALMRYGDLLVQRIRHALASLRPVTMDAIVLSILRHHFVRRVLL
jgi:hypothetical protein